MLKDHVVAVTGGFGQLGTAVARALAQHGARVALLDRAPIPAVAPVAALLLPEIDLASADNAARALDHVVRQLGHLDALVNVAGGFRWETLEDGSVDTWDLLYHLNVRTAVAASKAALPHLLARGAGRIVNIGAMGAIKAGSGMGPYAASKAAVAKLTESLAEELKDRHINVNAILPSIIDTPQNRADMPAADVTRWVTPQAIADVVVFLLSDASRAVTGASIPVAGRV